MGSAKIGSSATMCFFGSHSQGIGTITLLPQEAIGIRKQSANETSKIYFQENNIKCFS